MNKSSQSVFFRVCDLLFYIFNYFNNKKKKISKNLKPSAKEV